MLPSTQNSCETLTWEQEQRLRSLMEKLSDGDPASEESPPSFEQSSLQLM